MIIHIPFDHIKILDDIEVDIQDYVSDITSDSEDVLFLNSLYQDLLCSRVAMGVKFTTDVRLMYVASFLFSTFYSIFAH